MELSVSANYTLLLAVIQYKERKSVGFEVLMLACGHDSEGFSDPNMTLFV